MHIAFVPASTIIDWSAVQSLGADKSMPAASDTAQACEPQQEAAAACEPQEAADAWEPYEAAAAWEPYEAAAAPAAYGDETHHGTHGRQRNGLEPKVIGALVAYYRFRHDSSNRNWRHLDHAAGVLYHQRENITKTVDRILYK